MRPNEANAREPFKAIPKFIGCEWVQTNDPIISMASGDKKGVGKMAGRISQSISNFRGILWGLQLRISKNHLHPSALNN